MSRWALEIYDHIRDTIWYVEVVASSIAEALVQGMWKTGAQPEDIIVTKLK